MERCHRTYASFFPAKPLATPNYVPSLGLSSLEVRSSSLSAVPRRHRILGVVARYRSTPSRDPADAGRDAPRGAAIRLSRFVPYRCTTSAFRMGFSMFRSHYGRMLPRRNAMTREDVPGPEGGEARGPRRKKGKAQRHLRHWASIELYRARLLPWNWNTTRAS